MKVEELIKALQCYPQHLSIAIKIPGQPKIIRGVRTVHRKTNLDNNDLWIEIITSENTIKIG